MEEHIQKLQLALETLPGDDPRRTDMLYLIGRLFRGLFLETRDIDFLGKAIRFGQLALDITPQDHPDYAQRLNNVGNYFRERFSRKDDINDLKDAIRLTQRALSATPSSHPNYIHYLNNLGVYLREQYMRTGEIEHLEEAIRIGQLALDNTPANHPNHAERLTNLGSHFQQRFLRIGEIKDREKAIELGRLALDVTGKDDKNRARRLDALSTRLRDRFLSVGDVEDLEEAIRLGKLALDVALEDDTNRSQYLINLGGRFQDRFSRYGELADLKEATRLAQLALDNIPQDHPDRGHYLNRIGSLLGDQFSRFGDLKDLESSIRFRQQALDITPRDRPDYPVRLQNLGSCFFHRFLRRSEQSDLEEAIKLIRLALNSVPEDYPERGMYLDSLGLYLNNRFARTGSSEDLDEAIRLGRLAVDTVSDGHPMRMTYLNNLGIYLSDRFFRFGDLDDLEESIRLGKLAIDATPSDHPIRPQRLNNLGNRFRDRFLKKSEPSDLEAAILFAELALKSIPEDFPDRAYYLNNLANRLGVRYSRRKELKDIEESTRLFRQALHYPNGIPLARFTAGIYAAQNLASLFRWEEAAVAFEEAIYLLPNVTLRTSSRQDLQHTIEQFASSASRAASVFLKAGRSPLESLQILEQGRGIIAGLVVDSRSDVSALRDLHPDLYVQYIRLREIVATPLLPDLSPEDKPSQIVPQGESYAIRSSQRYKSATDLDEVLEQIRQQPEFSRFQLSMTKEEITNLAASGPLISFNVSEISAEAFIVTSNCVEVLELPNMMKMDLKSVAKFLSNRGNLNRRDAKLISKKGKSGVDENEEKIPSQNISSLMLSLWENAVKPVLSRLGFLKPTATLTRLPRIYWIGGGLMSILPLHAAGEHSLGMTENTLSHVVSSFAPSMKSLQFARNRPWKSLKGQDHKVLVVSMPETPGIPGHLNVEGEVSEIKSQVGTQASVKILIQPSKSEVLNHFKSSTIAHFACHGRADYLKPAKSALLLGKTSVEELSIEDLDAINHPQAQIAYLSACSTAEVRSFDLVDENIHLASTFLLTGFPHVIGTLWGAQDSAAAEVAKGFYKKLFEYSEDSGASVAYALHEAILSHRNAGGNLTDVLKWAPFIHIGS